MNVSSEIRLAPSGDRHGCGPHTPHTKYSTSSTSCSQADSKIHTKSYSTKNDYELNKQHEHFQPQVIEMFEKCFRYQKTLMSNDWCLPPSKQLFTEYYQFESLQQLKINLNQVKSKLNDYDIEDWSTHTRRQDPAGEIPWNLKTETDAEFVTIAWCKMYECLGRFPELIAGPKLSSLHLCEAPGAFITALNHYLHTNYDKDEIQWNWLATTLNPYYEGNSYNRMITDDRFLHYNLDKWLFHKDFTGNIIDQENLEHMKQQCEQRLGNINFITADGSIDCIESPECQEENVAILHYAETISALSILSDGGSFVIKMFTMFEASSVSLLYLLNCIFAKVNVFKPCTSKRGNSEVYVVCLSYKKGTKNLQDIIETMKLNLKNSICPLFAKSVLPVDFLTQHEICCRIFMNYQINAIEKNIYTLEIKPRKMAIKRLQNLRKAVCDEFYKRYKIKKLPNELKILYNYHQCIEKSYKCQMHKGSHSERELLKEADMEERIFKLNKYLNELEKMFKRNITFNDIQLMFETKTETGNIKLNIYRGQAVRDLNSSLFVNVHLWILRNKLNNLYDLESRDCVWLRQPRFEFSQGEDSSPTIINYFDFFSTDINFSLQQENFFKSVISTLLRSSKPTEIKFINMPFLTHYSVSLLRYLSCLTFTKLTFLLNDNFEVILSNSSENFVSSLVALNTALLSSIDQDILCFLKISQLHHNDFNKTLNVYNNMLLLKNCKLLLNN